MPSTEKTLRKKQRRGRRARWLRPVGTGGEPEPCIRLLARGSVRSALARRRREEKKGKKRRIERGARLM